MSGLVAVLIAATLGGAAQGPSGPPPREGREEAFRLVDAFMVRHLRAGLDLSDEQFDRFIPLVRRLQADRRQLAQRRRRAVADLRTALRSGTATEPQVQSLLQGVKALEDEEPAVLARDRAAIDAMLTPVQQAKFRILEVEIERRIRRAMSGARERRGRAPGRGEGPPPH